MESEREKKMTGDWTRFLAFFLCLSLGAGPPAFALRPAGLEEANPAVREKFLEALSGRASGMEETSEGKESGAGEKKEGPPVSRRAFLRSGGAGAATLGQGTLGAEQGGLTLDVRKTLFELAGLFEKWQTGGFPAILGENSVHAQLEKLGWEKIRGLMDQPGGTDPEVEMLRQQVEGFSQAASARLGDFSPSADPSVVVHPAQAALKALEDPKNFPLWLLSRTLPRILQEEFEVEGLDPNREFERARQAGLTDPGAFIGDLVKRYVLGSQFGREAKERYAGLGIPESELQWWMQRGLEGDYDGIAQGQFRVHPDREFYSKIRIRWVANDIAQKGWNSARQEAEKRIRTQFGEDAAVHPPDSFWKENFPRWDNPIDPEEAVRRYEKVIGESSVRRAWQRRVRELFSRRREKGAAYTREDLDRELERVEQLGGDELDEAKMAEDLARLEQQYPLPDQAAQEEWARTSVKIAPPLAPVEELAWHLSRAARQGPVTLWIRTDETGQLVRVRWNSKRPPEQTDHPGDAAYREPFLSKREIALLEGALGGMLYRRRPMRYRVEIPAGTGAAALSSFLQLSTWWRTPSEEKPEIVRVPWPIALPGPAGGLSSGLEERFRADAGIDPSV